MMTPEELARIRAAIMEVDENDSPTEIAWATDAAALLLEVERLTAENECYRLAQLTIGEACPDCRCLNGCFCS